MTPSLISIYPRLSLLLCLLLAPAFPLGAGSIEKIPANPDDLAAQLGIDMSKFEAKFDTPVYLTLQLEWKKAAETTSQTISHPTADPDQYHEILFVKKDFGQMQLKTGGDNAKQVKDIIEMKVRFGNTGFFHRDINPFANMKAGESYQTWSRQQSREALPLDEAIPLVISAGPSLITKPLKNLPEEYRSAPAFIILSATFSRTAPIIPAPAPPAPEKPATPVK